MGADATDVVRWEHRPKLRQPVLVVAFEGWSDAGDAASLAARYLAETWAARRFATIDPEDFFDFTVTRPDVRITEGRNRVIDWPETLLLAGPIPGSGRDLVILRGVEPQLRWRTFCAGLLGVVQALGVEMVLTLSALLADVPHTRPVRVTATGYHDEMVTRFGLDPPRYEGPTGIVGVLHDVCARAGVPSAGLLASVPHYVHQVSSPMAALALVERAAIILGTPIDAVELRAGAEAYMHNVNERVADDEDAAAYVAQLEEAADREQAEQALQAATTVLPTGDALADEVERFLRDHDRE